MGTQRLEAFSDGVLAIIITIMVLELKVPHGDQLDDLKSILPVFLSYILSFIYIGIYWNNHHHLMSIVEHVNGKVLWANMHLLFWLSIVPFASGWMGENRFTKWPIIIYGIALFMSGVAYYILEQLLIQLQGENSKIQTAVGKDKKGMMSVIIYLIAIGVAFFNSSISLILYALVAAMWLIPDRRIEKSITNDDKNK